jgi:hypothetical protein
MKGAKLPHIIIYYLNRLLIFSNKRLGPLEIEVVGLKAPSTVRDLHSEVRRDWKQLIGRKPAHTTAVKTGLGESPLKGGSPEE